MSKNLYIVPHDLTEVGNTALDYALFLGTHVQTHIMLLNLVDNVAKVPGTIQKLKDIIASRSIPSGVEIEYCVEKGDIFSDISKIANREHAQLILMGTHGAKGFQKLTGSWAMKVISSCDVPFIIVQKDTKHTNIKNIVVPIDLTKESLQIISSAGDLARIFDATVHVIGEKHSDEGLSQQTKNRVLLIRNKYDEKGAKCEVNLLKSGGSYAKKVLQYTADNSIDLIALAYHSESLLPQFDTFAQSLITNDSKLPCMIITAKPAGNLYF
jgi:nucleotide-binding universal stress UspA family protein